MPDREKIKKYFEGTWTAGFAVATVIGLLIAFISISASSGKGTLVGILIAAGAGAGIYFSFGSRPTDQEMDQWLKEDLTALVERARKKLGIEPEECIGETCVVGPGLLFPGMPKADASGIPQGHMPPSALRVGKDGKLRIGSFEYRVFFPTEKFLGTYECCWDFCQGEAFKETTDEYFYKDVVSVSTKNDKHSVTIPGKKKGERIQETVTDFENFALTLSSGDSISVTFTSESLLKLLKARETVAGPRSAFETAISSIRKFLREKK